MKDVICHWRLRGTRLRMEGTKLPCGHYCFPPRPTCPICAANKQKELTEKAETELLKEKNN